MLALTMPFELQGIIDWQEDTVKSRPLIDETFPQD